MDLSDSLRKSKPAVMGLEEWAARLELAACYRVVDRMGWSEMIANHITLRLPDENGKRAYLINPYGLLYGEVTARNLIKIDTAGNKLSDSPYPVNVAGFLIHSALHEAREDAHCIIHTHTTAGMAVATKEGGLRHENVYSAQLYGRLGYHDLAAAPTQEGPGLAADLSSNDFLILRNHGLLVVGPHVPAAFDRMWLLQRACEVQLATDSLAGANRALPKNLLQIFGKQMDAQWAGERRAGQRMFDAAVRWAGVRFEDLA
jgi:ribulose-5-phosphate 4-epimerase/fuculose-1-phosphate aldolase